MISNAERLGLTLLFKFQLNQAILIKNLSQQVQMSKEKAKEYLQMAYNKIAQEEILHRGFLKPIEIALNTYKSEIMEDNPSLKPGSLPAGLKIAMKTSPTEEKRFLKDVMEISGNERYVQIKENNQDNMLSLMKKAEGLELAICVCMYSEDKKMLKSTLAGVSENIANLVALQKLDPDQIGVFVMMDGIEKVDQSVIDYFEELEHSSNINLGHNIAPSLSHAEMINKAARMTDEEINEADMKNVNNIIFTPAQIQQRNNLRFEAIRHDYDDKKKLLNTIKELMNKKPLYDDLPVKLQPFFFQEAREERKRDYAQSDQQVRSYPDSKILQQYGMDINRSRPIVMRALRNAEKFCKTYLNQRQDLAYLSYFRRSVPYQSSNILYKHAQKQNNKLYMEESQNELNKKLKKKQSYTVMNLFMCVKYKNSGKLSSHNWFFNGFCKELRPKYAVLLDVGLRPEEDALMRMYKYMKKNDNVGGVCGYMSLKIEKREESEEINDDEVDFLTSITSRFFDIQRTQQVEYHFAHLMDKAFEASFGFIHVLPGAFSAYNMKAIFNYDSTEDDELLKAYFKSIDEKLKNRKVVSSEIGVKNAILRVCLPDFLNRYCIQIEPESDQAMLYDENVYLAEDRILCMGIHKKGFDMAYLPDAYAQVDPIKTVHGLLGQRKRWINGSYFAFEKVKKELAEHENQIGCQILLNIQIMYLTLMNSLSYFSPSFFLFTVHIAMQAFREGVLIKLFQGDGVDPANTGNVYRAFVYTMDFIYVMLLMTLVFYSLHLTNNNKYFKPYIYGISTLFGLFMLSVFIVLAVDLIRGLIYGSAFLVTNPAAIADIPGGLSTVDMMRWMLIGSLGLYVVPIVIYLSLFGRLGILCEVLLGSLSFLFYSPTYLNILNVYSLCRIDDISWGTKGLDTQSSKNDKVKGSWRLIKFVHVAKYVIWNIIVSAILLTLGASYAPRFFVTIIMVVLIGLTMSIKVLIAVVYMLNYWCRNRCCLDNPEPVKADESRISKLIKSYQAEIKAEIKDHLENVKNQYVSSNFVGSFIQASRSKRNLQNSFKKQKQLSNIQKKSTSRKNIASTNKYKPLGLATINEEAELSNKKRNSAEDTSGQKGKRLPPLEKIGQPIPSKELTNNSIASDKSNEEALLKGEPRRQSASLLVSEEELKQEKGQVRDKSNDKQGKNRFRTKKL